MEFRTANLILRTFTGDDLAEVARTWSDHLLPDAEAQAAISYMRGNHEKNAPGHLQHLCLAVCLQAEPRTIRGWCGLDGSRNPAEPEIFVILSDEAFRGRGYGTECMRELLRIAVEDCALHAVHGGCYKDNIASAKAMEKAGMELCGHEDNGDPRYRFVRE